MPCKLASFSVGGCREYEDVSARPPPHGNPAAAANHKHECSMVDHAVTCLRNLCHQEASYNGLLQCGAADTMAHMMAYESNPYCRLNAVMAVSLLVGQEENHHLLQLDEHLAQVRAS